MEYPIAMQSREGNGRLNLHEHSFRLKNKVGLDASEWIECFEVKHSILITGSE